MCICVPSILHHQHLISFLWDFSWPDHKIKWASLLCKKEPYRTTYIMSGLYMKIQMVKYPTLHIDREAAESGKIA